MRGRDGIDGRCGAVTGKGEAATASGGVAGVPPGPAVRHAARRRRPTGAPPPLPLLQPLALSAGTRHAVARHDGLLKEARSAAASVLSGQPLARLQRVRPRTLLAIAAAAGAFYFILPQLAQVSSGWQ